MMAVQISLPKGSYSPLFEYRCLPPVDLRGCKDVRTIGSALSSPHVPYSP